MDLNQGKWCDHCKENLYGSYIQVWNSDYVGWVYFCDNDNECKDNFFK